MNTARKLSIEGIALERGVVVRILDVIEVRLPASSVRATRAKSCLVAPEVGDEVLCALDGGEAFVLAVLRGRPDAGTTVAVDGDLTLSARGGRTALTSTEEVSIVSGGKLAICAEEGNVTMGELGFFARVVRAEASAITLVAEQLDSVVVSLRQRLKRSLRFVEGIDATRAGTIDQRADKLASLQGENTIVTARALAKIDGGQVKIG